MNDEREKLDLLRRMPVFGGINDPALKYIVAKSFLVDCLEGEYFFKENDPASSFFVIQSGNVSVEKVWHGRKVEIRTLGPGDCFGEMAIVDMEPRSASIKATEDCVAIEITRKTLHELSEREVGQYAFILMNMGREISRRLRTVSETVFEMNQVAATKS